MTPALWSVTALLVTAAVVVAWPVRRSRRRRRALFDVASHGAPESPPGASAVRGTGQSSGTRPSGGTPALPEGHGVPVPSVPAHAGSPAHGQVGSGPARNSTVHGRLAGPPAAPDRPYSPRPPGRRDSRRPVSSPHGALGPGTPVPRLSDTLATDGSDAWSSRAAGDGAPKPAGHALWAVVRAWTTGPALGAARRSALGSALTVRRGRLLLLVGAAGGVSGGVVAGPVGAAAFAGYGVLAVRAALGRRAGRLAVRARRRRLDQLSALAADLRAGLPVPALPSPDEQSALRAVAHPDGPTMRDRAGCADARPSAAGASTRVRPPGPADDGDRLGRLTGAAVRLADRTGAPLAELLERIEADARALDRGQAAASAQAAGARATALLLAALPLGGIGLGYGIGADPVSVLLHTPLGAACAVAAMGLQTVGLLWAERLGRTPGGAG